MSDGPTRREAARIVALAPAIATVKAANDQVVFGVVGAGARGQRLITGFNRIAGGRCAAICDTHEASLRQGLRLSKDKPRGLKDYRELLSLAGINAVVVATPLYTHFPIVRDALLAGKHVFCENTLVFKPEEVHALRALADERPGQVVQAGLQRRYSKFYQTARQMATKGFLGEVTNIHAQWHRNPGWTMNPNVERPRESNWRLFREFSGGLTSELASHQIDVANWVFNDRPEFVTGVGSLDWKRDGRDVYDNIALIFRYPEGRQLTYSSISTSKHLPMFAGARAECGETVMGTEGTIEITLGTEEEPALGLWFYEPSAPKVSKAEAQKEIERLGGATMSSAGRGSRVMPILLERDQFTGEESFLERELKYARRWLYSKGVMTPEEDRNPVEVQLESFVECCRSGNRPKAHVEAGLDNSTAVILANMAMDTGRRVYFKEMDKLGRAGRPKPGKT